MLKGGYYGKLLRVNLSTGNTSIEDIPDESILRKYIGGFGLGLWYLMKELPVGISALDPENPMFFINGPFVRTSLPCSNNCTLTTFNADTGFTAGRSHSHGWFGPRLAGNGYDGLIITGASDKWVYLWLDNGKVEIRDASKLLGKDTHETEDLIKDELGVPREISNKNGASVAAIGPAGENMCDGALIANDRNHSFAHSGVGTVMGSKRLKAIAVRGDIDKPIYNQEEARKVAKRWREAAVSIGGRLMNANIFMSDYTTIKRAVGLCVNNLTKNDMPAFGIGMSRNKITPRPCYRCPIGCAYDVEIVEGPYQGNIFTLSGGGEGLEGSATIVGAGKEPGEVWYLTELDDRLGFETSTVGCSMAVAFEAYEKGLITKEDTDGLELKWGDVAVIETLVRRIAHKEGKFATMLSRGPKVAAEQVGLPDAAVHIKGAGMNLHDWRRAWPVFCGQICGGGSGWPAPGFYMRPEPELGFPKRQSPLDPHDMGKLVASSAALKMLNDSIGNCWFATWGVPEILKLEADAFAAIVGWDDMTREELLDIGQRIVTLERIFNMKHGLTAADDYNISPRLLEPMPAEPTMDDPVVGKSIAPYVAGWIRDYYITQGWHAKSGKPLAATLKRLDLEEYTDIIWPKC